MSAEPIEVITPYDGDSETFKVEKVQHNDDGSTTVYARDEHGALVMGVFPPGAKVTICKRDEDA